MVLSLDSATVQAVNENGLYPIDFVSIIVDENVTEHQLYLSNGYKQFTFDGNTYLPTHELIDISSIDHTLDVRSNAIQITLGAVNDAAVQTIAGLQVVGSPVTIYRGYVDEDTGDLVSDPYNRWSGLITNYGFTEDNQRNGTVTFQIDCRNIVVALLERTYGRFTSIPGFQRYNSNDQSMEFVASLVDWNPRFGAES